MVVHHENLPKSAVGLPMEAWQQDKMLLSVVAGDEGRLGNSYVCLCLQGTTKTLITLFTELKTTLQNGFTNNSQTTVRNTFYSVYVYLRYSRSSFPLDI